MFRSTLYFLRLLLALLVGAGFLLGLYFAFGYFSGLDPVGLDAVGGGWLTENVEKRLGEVASWRDWSGWGKGLVGKLPLEQLKELEGQLGGIVGEDDPGQLVLTVGLVSDSHEDNEMLREALGRLKETGVDVVIHLGDLSRVGTKAEMRFAKSVLDESGLNYYVIPGDHDLWASEGVANFSTIFGSPYQDTQLSGVCLVLLDNSDVLNGLPEEEWSWLESEASFDCPHGSFVFAHIPPYHPSSERAMGEKSGAVKKQAHQLLEFLKDRAGNNGFKVMFTGDIHYSSRYEDPETGLSIIVVGALTRERNLQTPRFGILKIYSEEEWTYEDLVIGD